MSDVVTSICVLGRRKEGEFLSLRLPDGQDLSIPVRPTGPHPKSQDPQWTYEEKDGILHLTPSLLAQEHNFHTGYKWIVNYVRFDDTPEKNAYQRFLELNP